MKPKGEAGNLTNDIDLDNSYSVRDDLNNDSDVTTIRLNEAQCRSCLSRMSPLEYSSRAEKASARGVFE